MPYSNEHAARINDPDKYRSFRRQNDKFGKGIDAIWGVTKDGQLELQAIRFDAARHDRAGTRRWLKEHNYTPILFEAARGDPGAVKACLMLIKGIHLNGQRELVMEIKRKVGHVAPLSPEEKAFRSTMNDIFARQTVEARKNVERFVKAGGTILDKKRWAKETNELTLPIRWHPFKAGGDTALDAINFQLPEWIESKHVLDAIRNENFMFAREISDGTANRLQAELLAGMEDGETIAQLKSRIQGIDEEWADAGRAEMIARTETARAYSTGTTEAWKETNVVEAKVWDAAGDACPFCLAMHGTEVELDGAFKDLGDTMTVAGGGTMEFDYSAVGGPPLHPNCRCALTARLGEKRVRTNFVFFKGGPGSGNFGHAGRPGEVGGSGGGGGSGVDTIKEKLNKPEFRSWFSGSKVVDSSGNPLILYHGTSAQFDKFRTDKGNWFTTDYEYAKQNAGATGRVLAVALNIKNPMPGGGQDFSPEEMEKFDGREIEPGVWTTRAGRENQIYILDSDYRK